MNKLYPYRLVFGCSMCVLFISWQGEMINNSKSIVRAITQPWNKGGVQ